MKDAYDFAKFLIKKGTDSTPNTFDGNMKLQKLLVFSDLIHVSEYGHRLFNDEILAFKNGCVVEKISLRYKNDYSGLKKDSDEYQPDFSENEYTTLNTVLDIFGNASAKELSNINHTFTFWKKAFEKGTMPDGHHSKKQSVVNIEAYPEDIEKMREIIDAYKETSNDVMASELINGVTFFYDGLVLSDEILDELENFSLSAEDDAYTLYIDDGELVIY